jgi:hypothetical protein
VSVAEQELFEGKQYEIPFPKADGKEVTDLVVRLAGNLKLNRNDPEHVALIESLNLGRMVELRITAGVDSKGQSVKEDIDGTETVTYSVGLRLHEVVEAA